MLQPVCSSHRSRSKCLTAATGWYSNILGWTNLAHNDAYTLPHFITVAIDGTFAALFTWIRTNGKIPFPVRSTPVFYPLWRYEISGNFTNWSQLKTRCSHEYFCSQKKNELYHVWSLANRLVCLAKPFLFSPLFWLYFIRRIYEYGYKVKLLLGYAGLEKIWWILTKCRKQFGGKYNPLCLSTCITKNIVIWKVIFLSEKHIKYTLVLK